MSEKKTTTAKQKPEHEIRCGAVTASIFLRQSNCGYRYYDLSLSRSWASRATGKTASGVTFFHENEADLVQSINEACAWMRKKVAQDSLGEAAATDNREAL